MEIACDLNILCIHKSELMMWEIIETLLEGLRVFKIEHSR